MTARIAAALAVAALTAAPAAAEDEFIVPVENGVYSVLDVFTGECTPAPELPSGRLKPGGAVRHP